MLSLPFALIGGIWLVYLMGYEFSVAVAVGFMRSPASPPRSRGRGRKTGTRFMGVAAALPGSALSDARELVIREACCSSTIIPDAGRYARVLRVPFLQG